MHLQSLITNDEVQQYRRETRGTQQTIHFNNAGSSLPPDAVTDIVTAYLQEEALHGGYETEYTWRDTLDNTYTQVARLLQAQKSEIALAENASAAWWIAFNGINFNKGDIILTCEMEYVTNIIGLLHAQEKYGVQVKVIPNDERGNFNMAAFEQAITPAVKLIAVTHAASTTGNTMPVAEIGTIAKNNGIVYLLDACQSAGQMPLDVNAIGCDMLAVTGRKYLRAPRGTGFLYVRQEVQDKLNMPWMDGFSAPHVTLDGYSTRKDARRFELYERNRALTVGLGKAVEYALTIGIDRIWLRIQYLADLLRSRLATLNGITVHDRGDALCGIVTFSVMGKNGYEVKSTLAKTGINVSVGKAHSTLFFIEKHGLADIVRASVHYYNTEEEIDILCNALSML